jgi:hypothetical protein
LLDASETKNGCKPFPTLQEYNKLIIEKSMEKKIFTDKPTTKEQYLKFKEEIKTNSHGHIYYVAYYIFKHRLSGEERDKYLEDEVRHRCYKGLRSGRIIGSGGDMTENYAIPMFKNRVIRVYNEFAESDGEEK